MESTDARLRVLLLRSRVPVFPPRSSELESHGSAQGCKKGGEVTHEGRRGGGLRDRPSVAPKKLRSALGFERLVLGLLRTLELAGVDRLELLTETAGFEL